MYLQCLTEEKDKQEDVTGKYEVSQMAVTKLSSKVINLEQNLKKSEETFKKYKSEQVYTEQKLEGLEKERQKFVKEGFESEKQNDILKSLIFNKEEHIGLLEGNEQKIRRQTAEKFQATISELKNELLVQNMNYEDLRTRMASKHSLEVKQTGMIMKMEKQVKNLSESKV